MSVDINRNVRVSSMSSHEVFFIYLLQLTKNIPHLPNDIWIPNNQKTTGVQPRKRKIKDCVVSIPILVG